MNRRELLKAGVHATALAAMVRPGRASAQGVTGSPAADTIHVNPATGADANAGTRATPLRTLAEAGRRVSQSTGTGPLTVVLAKGIHAVGESMLLRPQQRSFTATNRLTIRAEFLPDEPGWTSDGMPTLIFTMPFTDPPTWNGRPDPAGGAADGILVETSHVSILGLKFLGLPVLEAPRPGIEHRLYGINRNSRTLDDLEIGHCMFLGDYVTNPIHVGIIANGNGLDVHHSIFRENKITVVYWQGGSRGHAMRNCVITGCYGSGLWTAGIASDFRFENNVVDDCRYVWTYQNAASAPPFLYNPDGSMSDIPFGGGAAADAAAEAGRGAAAGGGRGGAAGGRGPGGGGRGPIPASELVRYKVINCHFGKNQHLAGSGTGATLGYVPIDPGFMEMVGSKVTNQPVVIDMNQRSRHYLHPVAGSEAARIGAGLFAKTFG
jgi:hypothetical protein